VDERFAQTSNAHIFFIYILQLKKCGLICMFSSDVSILVNEQGILVHWKPRPDLITHMHQQTLCYYGYSTRSVRNRCEAQVRSQ